MSKQRLRIEGAARIAQGESLAFEFERSGQLRAGFLLRHEAGLVAYLNRCPHWGVDLDLGDERFYAPDLDRIYCKNHGALFRTTDGVCDHGPCLGQTLVAFAVEEAGNNVWVSWVEEP